MKKLKEKEVDETGYVDSFKDDVSNVKNSENYDGDSSYQNNYKQRQGYNNDYRPHHKGYSNRGGYKRDYNGNNFRSGERGYRDFNNNGYKRPYQNNRDNKGNYEKDENWGHHEEKVWQEKFQEADKFFEKEYGTKNVNNNNYYSNSHKNSHQDEYRNDYGKDSAYHYNKRGAYENS